MFPGMSIFLVSYIVLAVLTKCKVIKILVSILGRGDMNDFSELSQTLTDF